MQHTRFGRTGLSVSRLCLGTMTFGLQCDQARSNAIMGKAAEGGIDFFDTADSLAAAEKGKLPADLKTKLDDLTAEWRAIDADR